MSRTRIPRNHLVVAVVGIALLVWAALPLRWGGVVGVDPERGWLLVGGWAVVCGVVGGLLEGMASRADHPKVALALLIVTAFVASWMPFFAIGRWFDGQGYVMESASLFQPLAGWLLFIAVITAVAIPLARGTNSGGATGS